MEVLQTPRSQTSRHDYPPQRRKPHKKISRFPDKTQKSSQSLHFCPDNRKFPYNPLSECRLHRNFSFYLLFIRIIAYAKRYSRQRPEREIFDQIFEEPAVYPRFSPHSTSGFPSISDQKSLLFLRFFPSLFAIPISVFYCPPLDIRFKNLTPNNRSSQLGCFTQPHHKDPSYPHCSTDSFHLNFDFTHLRIFAYRKICSLFSKRKTLPSIASLTIKRKFSIEFQSFREPIPGFLPPLGRTPATRDEGKDRVVLSHRKTSRAPAGTIHAFET